MYMRIFFTLWASLWLLDGCAMKKPEVSEPYVIVFKTPEWRFADTGYIRKGGGVTELEVFEAGQRILRLQFGKMVCFESRGCIDKREFNARYLSADYPEDLFANVLNGRPIYAKLNLKEMPEGFEQAISLPKAEIIYRVSRGSVYFKDRINRILIKLKPI